MSLTRFAENVLSKKALMAPITRFIQRRTREGVAAEQATMKMWKPLNSQILESDGNHISPKSVSPPFHTASGLCSLQSYKCREVQANRCRSDHCSCSRCVHRRPGNHEKRSLISFRLVKLVKSDESPSSSESDFKSNHSCSRRAHR